MNKMLLIIVPNVLNNKITYCLFLMVSDVSLVATSNPLLGYTMWSRPHRKFSIQLRFERMEKGQKYFSNQQY